MTAQVRAALDRLGRRLGSSSGGDPADMAQARYLSALLLNHVQDDLAALSQADRKRDVAVPPGMPIGGDGGEDCWLCESMPRLGEP